MSKEEEFRELLAEEFFSQMEKDHPKKNRGWLVREARNRADRHIKEYGFVWVK